jgi:thiosulfate reductase cytochrome b subunit
VLVGLVFTAAFLVAGAEEGTLERMQVQAPTVKRWGGWILVAVGLWFLVLAVFADFFADIFPV